MGVFFCSYARPCSLKKTPIKHGIKKLSLSDAPARNQGLPWESKGEKAVMDVILQSS